jgi:uncharacterized protein (DUF302 family)
VARTRKALADAGFGVLTEIDVSATMKKKIGADMAPYLILGACMPLMALEALKAEPQIGLMLPCNVIVRDLGDGKTEIAAIDPVASMQAVANPALAKVAGVVQSKLRDVIAAA